MSTLLATVCIGGCSLCNRQCICKSQIRVSTHISILFIINFYFHKNLGFLGTPAICDPLSVCLLYFSGLLFGWASKLNELLLVPYCRSWQTFSVKDQIANIFVFAGHMICHTLQFCYCSAKAATDNSKQLGMAVYQPWSK